jgi:hypothetical protein
MERVGVIERQHAWVCVELNEHSPVISSNLLRSRCTRVRRAVTHSEGVLFTFQEFPSKKQRLLVQLKVQSVHGASEPRSQYDLRLEKKEKKQFAFIPYIFLFFLFFYFFCLQDHLFCCIVRTSAD